MLPNRECKLNISSGQVSNLRQEKNPKFVANIKDKKENILIMKWKES